MAEQRPRRSFDRFLRLRRRRQGLSVAPELPDVDVERLVGAIAGLLGERERTTQRAMASRVLHAYAGLDEMGRARFLGLLANRFGTDDAAVLDAVDAFHAAEPGAERMIAERALRRAVTPRHAEFLHLVTGLPDGVKLLVDLRAELLGIRARDPALGFLDDELAGHLSTLFDVGLLELRRITWDGASAAVLEKLIAYEAVHEIDGFEDLKHRLESDRRCYAFFHPAMPDEPLVFVEIALVRGMATELRPLLDLDSSTIDPEDADAAVFYSITSPQRGLAGVALGNELIKQVVEALRRDLPRLETFVTLSPIPRFRPWLEARVAMRGLSQFEQESVGLELRPDDAVWLERARPGLLSLCARYLTTLDHGRAADPVGNFHLSNGAVVERVNWMANPASYGMAESLGLMVNYRYDLDAIGPNARAYLNGETITASNRVKNLIK
ncbi:MAG: malonyl-CoA decarboxylase family protein [Acidobacteria bacterium]|nr:malonyl-CoA decarboxylase family protein [Acidobacteriota bacterium]